MNVEYKRDLNHVYLIIKGIRPDPEAYQVRMLLGNSVPMILKCRMVNVDNEYLLYFDITSKQKLSAVYAEKKLSYDDLFLILSETVSAMEMMEEYLLKPEQLILDPEYMYLDADGKRLFFVMMPGERGDPGAKFRILMEALLPCIDHDRKDAVSLGYGIYRIAAGSFSLEEIRQILYGRDGKPDKAGSRSGRMQTPGLDAEWKEKGQDHDLVYGSGGSGYVMKNEMPGMESAPGKKSKYSGLSAGRLLGAAACVLSAAGILALSAAGVYGVIPGITADTVLGVLIVCLAAVLLGYRILEKRKLQTRPAADERGKSKEQDLYRQLVNEPDTVTERTEMSLFRGPVEKEEPGETVYVRTDTDHSLWVLKSLVSEIPDICLDKEITLIGKLKQTCDAVLKEETVSRIHARIRLDGGEYRLMDMNSRNGTFVNGRPLETGEEYLLTDGDKIAFGRAEFEFCRKRAEGAYPYEI